MDSDTKYCLQKDLYHHKLKVKMFQSSLLGTTRTARKTTGDHTASCGQHTHTHKHRHVIHPTPTHIAHMLLCWCCRGFWDVLYSGIPRRDGEQAHFDKTDVRWRNKKSEGSLTNQDVSFTSRRAALTTASFNNQKKRVQANCTVRSLQYVITQYSTHVHMIGSSWERGESHLVFLHQDLFKQDFFFFLFFTPRPKSLTTLSLSDTRLHRNLDRLLPPAASSIHRRILGDAVQTSRTHSTNLNFPCCCCLFTALDCFSFLCKTNYKD